MDQHEPPAPQDQMMQWITSKWVSKPIHLAAELGIADLLRSGPREVEDLAQQTGTHAPTLARLMRALAAVGIFAEVPGGRFSLTPLAECLLSEALRPQALMFLSLWHDKAWDSLGHCLKTGQPGFDHAFGEPSFGWLEKNPQARRDLDMAQAAKAVGFARGVLQAYDFSGSGTICDLGGGQGVFLTTVLAAHPQLAGIVADMPGAAPAAQETIAKAGVADRCQFISLDFFRDPPPVADTYIMANILHDWDDQACRGILHNLAAAMNPASKLLLVEYLLEPGPGFNVAKLLDLEMLVMSGGRERTPQEYQDLLQGCGFDLKQTFALPGELVLMQARLTG